MKGKYQHLTREQGQRELTFQQKGFKGGQVSDIPATDIDAEDAVLLDNAIAFDKYAAGRSGSQVYSNTALPGSGAVHSIKQHHISKRILLHRGSQLWISDAAMTTWTEVIKYSADLQTVTLTGTSGASGVFTSIQLKGLNAGNTNAGVLYWDRIFTGIYFIITFYKDAAKTLPVANAINLGGAGGIFTQEQNNSGISGVVVVTGNTVSSHGPPETNTILGTIAQSYGLDTDSRIQTIDENFIVFVKAVSASYQIAHVNAADQRFVFLNAPVEKGYPKRKVDLFTPSSGNEPAPTDTNIYGYRYLITFSRILTTAGAYSSTVDRITGSLIFESAANDFFAVASNSLENLDYAEGWTADPAETGVTISLLNGFPTYGSENDAVGAYASSHYTHVSLYRTADIGVNGIDPISGVGNNREIFVWVKDVSINGLNASVTADTYQVIDTISDDVLKARYLQGFGLKTRFFKPIPSGEAGEIQGSFLLSGQRDAVRIDYCQLSNKENIGFNQPLFQFFKLDDGLKLISKSPDLLTLVCANKTYIVNPSSYTNAGVIESIFVLNYIHVASETIGVVDYSSMTELEGGTFVAICSDHSVRFWNGSVWGPDISSQKVNKIIRTMVAGTVVGYFAGSFHIWYRDDSSQTYNNKCIRYGMGRDNGFGWSQVSGSAWSYPYLICGALLIQDANAISRLLVLDSISNLFYWIETFTSFTGSNLSKIFKDKVATNGTGGTDIVSRIRFRELIGTTETDKCYHEQTNGHVRPYDENVGYLGTFKVNMKGYADGNPTPLETVSNVPKDGDYQFWTMIEGNRIQVELTFDASGYLLTTLETTYQAMKKISIGEGPAQTDEAAYQLALAGF